MITVNGWCAGGKGGGVVVQSMGEMGKDCCPDFLQQPIYALAFYSN